MSDLHAEVGRFPIRSVFDLTDDELVAARKHPSQHDPLKEMKRRAMTKDTSEAKS